MNNQLLFFQTLFQMMEREGISFSFDGYTPAVDHTFWDRLTACRNTDDRRLLEDIAACLREDTSDFLCIDQIICLLSDGGFDTGPRHDFG